MQNSVQITAKMFDSIDYDETEVTIPVNNLKKDGTVYEQVVLLSSITPEIFIACVRNHIKHIAAIEAEDNCLPFYVAEKHLNLAIDNYDPSAECVPLVDSKVHFAPIIQATWDVSLFEVVSNLLLAATYPEIIVSIRYDAPRYKIIAYLIANVLENHAKVMSNAEIITHELHRFQDQPYSTMLVFDSGDLNAAAQKIAHSFDDPSIPWRIRSVLVQENCYEAFCDRLKSKVKAYSKEILSDALFVERSETAVKVIEGLKINGAKHQGIKPTISYEFGREFFDEPDQWISPAVVLKVFRTVKEAISLAKQETGGLATVWTENKSISYEVVNSLDVSVVWINCLGVLHPSIPFSLRKHSNCIGSEFAIIEHLQKNAKPRKMIKTEKPSRYERLMSAVKISKPYHFEYFATETAPFIGDKNAEADVDLETIMDLSREYWRNMYDVACNFPRKTIVFPFGVTFAN